MTPSTPPSDPRLKVDPNAPTLPAPAPTVPPRPSKRPTGIPPAPRTKSGQHPAAIAYRSKLASIQDGAGAALDELAEKITRETEALKTPLPPPLEDEERATPTPEEP